MGRLNMNDIDDLQRQIDWLKGIVEKLVERQGLVISQYYDGELCTPEQEEENSIAWQKNAKEMGKWLSKLGKSK